MTRMLKDGWATRFGLIMAMAGNAVGLGNFLRFPGKAAPYGGAFMIPYFAALILIGIPLMWVEWTIGRHGGAYAHGTTPGMFHRLWRHPISKYLGIFGILLPAMVGVYYIYIESWSLGYAWQTMTGAYWGKVSNNEMAGVFNSYLGMNGGFVSFSAQAYIFFLITFAVNIFVFGRGISKGIEVVARYCMPLLLILGTILAVRVLTLPPVEGRSISDGLGQIWRVDDWSKLTKPDIWITAAGQIFFTLSVGLGMVHTYASYLRRDDDITLSGLAACGTNEFVEVVLGSTIAIPAAVIFFGVAQTQQIAAGGTFSIGFFALPVIFQQMPGGQIFGTMWFVLLFLAGLTSSMAMFTPLLVFLEDELQVPRRKGVALVAAGVFLVMQPIILFMHHGLVDEMDYWMGEFCLVLFVAIESVVFAWIFGMDRGWAEMHEGADLQVPRVFYYVIKYVTPVFAVGLVAWYVYAGLLDKVMMTDASKAARSAAENVSLLATQLEDLQAATRMAPQDFAKLQFQAELSETADALRKARVKAQQLQEKAEKKEESKPYLWLARGIMLGMALFLVWGVWYAWRTHPKFFEEEAGGGEAGT